MTAYELAQVHAHDQTGSLPIVSRALLECHAERMEQARLLGMSGSREAALQAKIQRLREALQRIDKTADDESKGYPYRVGFMQAIASNALSETET